MGSVWDGYSGEQRLEAAVWTWKCRVCVQRGLGMLPYVVSKFRSYGLEVWSMECHMKPRTSGEKTRKHRNSSEDKCPPENFTMTERVISTDDTYYTDFVYIQRGNDLSALPMPRFLPEQRPPRVPSQQSSFRVVSLSVPTVLLRNHQPPDATILTSRRVPDSRG